MNGNFDRPFGYAKLLGNLPHRVCRRVGGEESLECFEQRELTGCFVILPQADQRAVEERECPAALEDSLRRPVVGRFVLIAPFAVSEVEGDDRMATTALLRC